jgi:hypothetical protein
MKILSCPDSALAFGLLAFGFFNFADFDDRGYRVLFFEVLLHFLGNLEESLLDPFSCLRTDFSE